MEGSWFRFLPFWENLQNLMHVMGWPFNEAGETWGLLGSTYDIEHNPGHGAEAFVHVLFVVAILTITSFLVYGKIRDAKAALIPEEKLTLRTVFEILVGTTYSMMSDIMGKKAARFFLPLIGTCALFILLSNTMGLLPGFAPPTSSMNVTLACAIIIFFTTHIFGIKEQGAWPYLKHFFGPILFLAPLIFVIEIISHLVRPMSLSIRLMANMFADHAVLSAFFMLSTTAGLYGFFFPVPVLMLGSLVVVVQALVFCLLSTVYIATAIEHAEEH